MNPLFYLDLPLESTNQDSLLYTPVENWNQLKPALSTPPKILEMRSKADSYLEKLESNLGKKKVQDSITANNQYFELSSRVTTLFSSSELAPYLKKLEPSPSRNKNQDGIVKDKKSHESPLDHDSHHLDCDDEHEEHKEPHAHGMPGTGPALALQGSTNGISLTPSATYALSAIPQLSSNPNSPYKIYLDFDGSVTSGTFWNSIYTNGAAIVQPAYSMDSNTTSFSQAEIDGIVEIWRRVSEDFAPFNLDITTINPGTFTTRTALQVAIGGGSSSWMGTNYGGVAWLDTWTLYNNTPVFAFPDWLYAGTPKYVADAVAHEVGHALGLEHQSTYSGTTKTNEYNPGGGGWAPIMGDPFFQALTTWSNGTNKVSSTTYQDEMALISRSANAFGYRADDHGNTNATATILTNNASGNVSAAGIISTMSDLDVFSFVTNTGNISFNLNLAPFGPNLDGILELRDSSNTLIASGATNVPGGLVTANISRFLNAGTYYLGVKSNGQYGRVGQYTINGTVVPSTQLSIRDVSIVEGNSGTTNAVFNVTLSQASSSPVTVNYATADGTATVLGNDYSALSGTLTFNPGETSKTIAVAVKGDLLNEANETFFLNLSGATNALIANNQGLGTILDDDATLSISNANIVEGNSGRRTVVFTVNLSKAIAQAITVNYATANGTSAVLGNDYLATSGSLTFNAGETSKTISVEVVGDTINEIDETFFVNLSNATNAAISRGQGIGTIQDDDPTISINGVSTVEGNRGTRNFSFTVRLSKASDQTITVQYATADGNSATAANNATTANNDYRATSGILTFNPGVISQTITVQVVGDRISEGNESFLVNLSNATGNASLIRSQGIGTILNDDSSAFQPAGSLGVNSRTTIIQETTKSESISGFDSNALLVGVNPSFPISQEGLIQLNDSATDYQLANSTENFSLGTAIVLKTSDINELVGAVQGIDSNAALLFGVGVPPSRSFYPFAR